MSDTITMSEWMAEVQRLSQTPDQPGLITTREIMEARGCGIRAALRLVRDGLRNGLLENGHRKRVIDVAGRGNWAMAYKIITPEKKRLGKGKR